MRSKLGKLLKTSPNDAGRKLKGREGVKFTNQAPDSCMNQSLALTKQEAEGQKKKGRSKFEPWKNCPRRNVMEGSKPIPKGGTRRAAQKNQKQMTLNSPVIRPQSATWILTSKRSDVRD